MEQSFDLIKKLQKSWQNLDVGPIEGLLSENFEYGSQMVLSNIYGKENYIDYLKGKFLTIKNSGDTIFAEIGKFKGQYCLLVAQRENTLVTSQTITRNGVLLLEYKEGFISKAHMCSITPTKYDVELLP